MRILFLSRWFPYPPDNGAKIRIFNVLKQLSLQHEIVLVTFAEPTDRVNDETLTMLRQHCVSVRVLPNRQYRATSARALLGLFSSRPRYLAHTFSEDAARVIREEAKQTQCELLIASQLGTAQYALEVPGVPALLEELELSLFRDGLNAPSLRSRVRSRLAWMKLNTYLRHLLPRFDAITVVSERERINIRDVAPHFPEISVIPNAVDASMYAATPVPPRPNTAIYSGALTYSANYDALRYFLSEVYPSIKAEVPEFTLTVTGDTTGVNTAKLPTCPGVQYIGYVPDIRPVLAQSWMSVVPLRQGGGTRLKILEAMASGTPVLATSKGAEGLDVTDGEDILLADGARCFKQRAVQLLGSTELRSRLAGGGKRLVESKYDWRVIGPRLNEVVERVSAGRISGGR